MKSGWEISNLKELAHHVVFTEFLMATHPLTEEEQEAIVLRALRKARMMASDPTND